MTIQLSKQLNSRKCYGQAEKKPTWDFSRIYHGPGKSKIQRGGGGGEQNDSGTTSVTEGCSNGFEDLYTQRLSGILPTSGLLNFATKNSFPLFFVCEKCLVHMYQNHLFPNSLFLLCNKPKTNFACNGVSAGDRRLKSMDFDRRATAN